MFVEIRIRGFYTGDSANATPEVCLLGEVQNDTLPMINLAERIAELKEAVSGLMMRPMTETEVEAYRAKEDAEEGSVIFHEGELP